MKNEPFKNPPKWSIYVLRLFCPEALYEGILGDLLEQYNEIASSKGLFRARLKFVFAVVRLFHPVILFKNKKVLNIATMGLFKNHFLIVIRSMRKYKFYSFINISGLVLAMTFVFLAYLFIQGEVLFDNFNEKKDQIYRVHTYRQDAQSGLKIDGTHSAITPVPLAKKIYDVLPEVSNFARFGSLSGVVNVNGVFYKETICLIDPTFLNMFSYPVISGSKEPLEDISSIVLSQEMVEKFFGDVDPIGKEIELTLNDSTAKFVVRAIIDNRKSSSSIKFDFLLPFQRMGMAVAKRDLETFEISFIESWIEFDRPLNSNISETLSSIVMNDVDAEKGNFMVEAFPLNRVHSETQQTGLATFTNPLKIWVLTGLSILVLVIAVTNFIILTTSNSMRRSKEIGVRKSLGAARRTLVVQIVFESFMVVMIASCIGLIMTYFTLPVFNQMIEANINWTFSWSHIGFLFLISLCIGLISGGIQSSILVRFASIVKNTKVLSTNEGWLNKGLIISQFVFSMILIIGALIMSDQMMYIQQKDLGFNKDRLVEISLQTSNDNRAANALVEKLKTEMLSNPNISGIGASMNSLKEPWTQLEFAQLDGTNEKIYFNKVDVGYIDAMKIELVSGQKFLRNKGSDITDIIVNEALVDHFGWEDAINKEIPGSQFNRSHRIIGVVKDFHFSSLHKQVEPIILTLNQRTISSGVTGISTYIWPPNLYQMIVRIGSGDLFNTISFLNDSWKSVNPTKPFTYNFVDETLANNYKEEARWNMVIKYASFFAVFIAWIGLLGLVQLSVMKRIKEIAIRKVLGSSIVNLVQSLTWRFVALIVVANFIAWPIAWLSMSNWLETFTYRIDLSIANFVCAGAAVLLVVIISVGMQSYKAAAINPVDSLKYE